MTRCTSAPEFYPKLTCAQCAEEYTVYDVLRDPTRCYRCVRLFPAWNPPRSRP